MGKYWTPTRKGAINSSHATARHAIVEVYKLNGGVQGLWNWMRKSDENERAFYTILLPKLIPAEIADQHGTGDNRIQVVVLPATSQAKVLDESEQAGGTCRQVGGAEREPEA